MNNVFRQWLAIGLAVTVTAALLLGAFALSRSAWARTNDAQSDVGGDPSDLCLVDPETAGYSAGRPYSTSGQCVYGTGMMCGWGAAGVQGCEGYGVMGPWGETYPEGTETLSMDEAKAAVERFLEKGDTAGLEVAEVMEFSDNFYAIAREESSGIGAFEVLVDKVSGAVYLEPGPNMMWNLKYGMMGGGYGGAGMTWGYGGMGMMGRAPEAGLPGEMPVDEARAIGLAQDYLDSARPGSTADHEADAFYGYYTLHVLTDGQITGMLSVNGYTGHVWYHTWHGAFVGMTGDGHN